MTRLLRHLSWRHLRRTVPRTILVLVGITLGVAMAVCVQESVQAAATGLARSVESAAGRAQLEVRALDETGLDESVLAAVRAVAGVAQAVPVIEVNAHVGGHPGRTLLVTGLDLLDDATLDFHEDDLRTIQDSLLFLAKTDSIAVGEDFARRNALDVGSPLSLVTSRGKRDFVVRGLLGRGTRSLGVGGDVGLMDLYAAQRAFGREGRLDRIDIALAAGADGPALTAALQRAVGGAAQVGPPVTRDASIDRMLLAFRVMTTFVSLMAVAAACILVFSVTTIAVAQRRREVAMLRALGASRRQAIGLFVAEAAILGGLGSLAGVGAGMWAARLFPQALSWFVGAAFRVQLDVGPPSVHPGGLALHFLVSAGAVVTAALLAARHAAAIPVIEALRALPPEDAARVRSRRRLALAAAVAALAVATVLAQRQSGSVLLGGADPPLVFLAVFIAAPCLIAACAPRLIGAVRRLGGAPAQLALRNVACQGERLAAPVVVLTLGLSMVIVIGAIAASFEQSVLGWLARGSALDLVVASSGAYIQRSAALLDEGLGDELRTVAGVGEVRPLRDGHVRFRGVEVGLRAWALPDPPTERDIRRYDFRQGDRWRAVAEIAAGPAVLVSQSLATRFHLGCGDEIELPTPHGSARFAIAGVVLDFLSPAGTVILSREQYRRLWQDPLVDAFGIGLAPGASPQATRERIAERLGPRFDLVVLTMGDFLGEARTLIHRAFVPLRGIEVVVLLIGLLSLLNALLVWVGERLREFGLLRASGASRGQLVRMILLEAMATSTIAALLGIAVGVYGSHSWIRVHIPVATGWIVEYAFPLGVVAVAVVLALALAALAGAYPGRLAARMEIVDALRAE